MKTLELELNKRLLIVEVEVDVIGAFIDDYSLYTCVEGDNTYWHTDDINIKKASPICKGSELTEDIAMGLVELNESSYYKDYKNDKNFFTIPSKSFISAIKSKGYHWGGNPIKFDENVINWEIRHKNRIDWERAESRTFNPDKTIIFEIL